MTFPSENVQFSVIGYSFESSKRLLKQVKKQGIIGRTQGQRVQPGLPKSQN